MMDNGGSAMDEDDEVTSTQLHIECSHTAQLGDHRQIRHNR